jgi:predicted RND superfamily exporter protein
VGDVLTALQKIRFKLQRDPEEWESSSRPTPSALAAARASLDRLQAQLRLLPANQSLPALETFQRDLTADFAAKLHFLQRNVHPTPITVDDIPETLRQRFIGNRGQYLLQIFARDNIWERHAMRAFVTQLQTIDPHVTGPPVVAFHSIRQIQYGYARAGLYALAVIVGVILLLVRGLKPLLFALLPVVLGGLWTLACMALVGLNFNMANLIILPLFLGIAVDGGIYMVHRMLEEPQAMTSPLTQSTGKAIVLTSLTTMVGFGGLMVARHSGIFSLGLLSTLAVGCTLLATLIALPLVLHLLPPRMRSMRAQSSPSAHAVSETTPPSAPSS